MPTYVYTCVVCKHTDTYRRVPMATRDKQPCRTCGRLMRRHLSAPAVLRGHQAGPDRFTADMLGVPEKDLPAGLRANKRGR